MEDYIVLKNVLTSKDIDYLNNIKSLLKIDPESHRPRASMAKELIMYTI